MRVSGSWPRRWIAGGLVGLVLSLSAPFGTAATGQVAPPAARQPDKAVGSEPPQTQTVTQDTNGVSQPSGTAGTAPTPPSSEPQPSPSQSVAGDQSSSGPPSAPEPAQSNPSKQPLGTAAAPAEKVTGVAASRPAGAAIAPSKQRRVRSILIKVGIILGAAVAIGTVAALSKGSPSRPN